MTIVGGGFSTVLLVYIACPDDIKTCFLIRSIITEFEDQRSQINFLSAKSATPLAREIDTVIRIRKTLQNLRDGIM
jgi:hypothetical protein